MQRSTITLLGAAMITALAVTDATAQFHNDQHSRGMERLAREAQGVEDETEEAIAATEELSPRERILQKLYYETLTVDFDGTAAQDAINFIANALDIPISARYLDQEHISGIDPVAPITLRVEGGNALDVIEMVLEQCSDLEACTWQLRGSFLEVGTKERLASEAAQEIKVYPVGDLLFEAPDFHDAPSLRLEDELYAGYPAYGYAGHPYGRFGVGRGGYEPYLTGQSRGNAYNRFQSGTTIGHERPSMRPESERANELVELITDMIEPSMWDANGGFGASIRYHDGALVVRAPDFIHRQLAGYPDPPKPVR